MAISVTWHNVFILVGLITTIMAAFVAGTGTVMQWRIDAVQNQLQDRMVLFQREVAHIEKRLDALENRH